MPRVSLRCHGDLDDLLPRGRRSPLAIAAPDGATAGAIVEDLGIPHTEIGTLSANGHPVPLAWRPAEGDELAVYPVGPPATRCGAPPRFLLDVHLGRLARLLRLLGFDAAWSRDAVDADLAAVAAREGRVLLSRDRGLLKRREVHRGCLVRSQEPRRQLVQIAERYGLKGCLAPFSRCLVCNAPLSLAADPSTGSSGGVTGGCPSCGRRYWRGSHWHRLNAVVEEIRCGTGHRRTPRDRTTARRREKRPRRPR
jgi:uncharacterized protein with PIN domain